VGVDLNAIIEFCRCTSPIVASITVVEYLSSLLEMPLYKPPGLQVRSRPCLVLARFLPMRKDLFHVRTALSVLWRRWELSLCLIDHHLLEPVCAGVKHHCQSVSPVTRRSIWIVAIALISKCSVVLERPLVAESLEIDEHGMRVVRAVVSRTDASAIFQT